MSTFDERRVVRKSIGYVTLDGQILFFTPLELPDSGAELPGGTLEPDEDPEAGLLRELEEETGLTDFGAPEFLGMMEFDPADDRNEIHNRYFYHVPLRTRAPATWERVVEEGNGTFTFQFFWVRPDALPANIHAGHDVFVRTVAARVENT